VATQGAQFCAYKTTIDRAQADEVVDTLAAPHGRFRGSERFAHDLRLGVRVLGALGARLRLRGVDDTDGSAEAQLGTRAAGEVSAADA
jgi:hypothetical protein